MPEITISDVTTSLLAINIADMMAGLPVDWSKVPDKTLVIKMAVHCAINGPVGIGKTTSFPTVTGQMTIRSVLGQPASNSGWKKTVEIVAKAINQAHPGLQCTRRRMKGDLWPLVE
jgi:hypothetical protein